MDPVQILKTEWPVISGAPSLTIGFCIIVVVVTWLVTKQFSKAEIAGLKAKSEAKDERLLLAGEKVMASEILLKDATAKLAELTAQQSYMVPSLQITATTAALAGDLARLTTTNAELYTTISPINFRGEASMHVDATVVKPTRTAE